jgi:hypothetical protein
MSKLCSACYAVRTVKAVMSQETVRKTYFSYVHSTMSDDTIFVGNSPYSINILGSKKKSQLLQIQKTESLAANCLKTQKYYFYVHSIYTPYHYL